MWVHHPAFGAPLVAPGVRIRTSASTILADTSLDGPGNPLEPGTSYRWPIVRGRDGGKLDLSVIPPGAGGRRLLGYLAGFGEGSAAIENDDLDLACTLSWDSTCFRTPGCGRSSAPSRSSGSRTRLHDRDRAGDELPRHRAGRRRRDDRDASHPSCRSHRSHLCQPSSLRDRSLREWGRCDDQRAGRRARRLHRPRDRARHGRRRLAPAGRRSCANAVRPATRCQAVAVAFVVTPSDVLNRISA